MLTLLLRLNFFAPKLILESPFLFATFSSLEVKEIKLLVKHCNKKHNSSTYYVYVQ